MQNARKTPLIETDCPPTLACANKAANLSTQVDCVHEDGQEEVPYWQFSFQGETYYAWNPESLEALLDECQELEWDQRAEARAYAQEERRPLGDES
jgi:hypothetical protein